jgi:hypothetical protein
MARLEWLVNPTLGGLGVILIFFLARGLYGPRTAIYAAVLFSTAAWLLFMSASYMNHVGAMTLAVASWALIWGPRRRRQVHLVAAGTALAAVATIRPLDAVAAAVPIACWFVFAPSAPRSRAVIRSAALLAMGATPIALVWGYFNWRVFGNALTTGYAALYGPAVGIGFHQDPYGEAFTPAIALSNMAVAVRRLHIYLFEWPIPALLPLAVWGVASRHRHPSDLIVAAGAAAAPLLYFFYWHSGFYLGPRFYYAAVPWLILGTARAGVWMWRRARQHRHRGFSAEGACAAAVILIFWWGWAGFFPDRLRAYRGSFPTFKLHPERQLADQNVDHAIVLVPESWGSRVIVGLWALGVPPGVAEAAYRRVDHCDLYRLARRDTALTPSQVSRDVEGLSRATVTPVSRIPGAPDPTLRVRTDRPLPEECRAELVRDLQGFTVFGNLAWRNPVGLDRGIIFARDQHDRNTELLSRHPGWPVWRFAPPPGHPTDPPVLTRSSVSREPG